MRRFIICVKGVGLSKKKVLEEMQKTNLEVDDIGVMYIADTTNHTEKFLGSINQPNSPNIHL